MKAVYYNTELDAARAWVKEFNAIPISVIEKLVDNGNFDEVNEITPPCLYDRVNIFADEWNGMSGEIIETRYDDEDDLYMIKLDSPDDEGRQEVIVSSDCFEVERDSYFPMWGTMWAFGEQIDNDWLNPEYRQEVFGGKNNLQKMADCGFRIYEQEDYGYIFGIDGAGYDFYEQHWIPLYRARGLHWHCTEKPTVQAKVDENGNVSGSFCGVDCKIDLSLNDLFSIHWKTQQFFDEEDIQSEIENGESLGEYTRKEADYIREHLTETRDLYRDIMDNSDAWHDDLVCAIKEMLSSEAYKKLHERKTTDDKA